MNRLLSAATPRTLPPRAHIVPIASTILGSALSSLPLIATAPILPPLGLLMALNWRLLRSELWRAWMALPLGLIDDLLTGAPIGSGMVLWTSCFLAFDVVDNRLIWRDHWQDWLISATALTLCLIGGWLFVRIEGGGGSLLLVLPQLVIAILCTPALVRLCARLDRWRLHR
ncbi:MAG: rod shape-determining protein MreD [Sphingomonas bacterium]|nr:rod shape-determining protein MreD [Sphingomonas bacterium]MDB5684806.1 rod shape-determining protein MreD [Sphingomonas bacterium]MDB5718130.1 rod shape-determining protein MreD [Sphingomonas bacterium]